jgi:DNA-binding SARP family transcriptional activator/WD40 repeat protein
VRFGLLGPTEVEDGRGPVAIGGAVPRRLLTALLVEHGRTVLVDRLVLSVWGEDAPATAERSLQSHVTRLRDVLGRDGTGPRLTFAAGGYRLEVDPDALDVTRFAQAVLSARMIAAGEPERAAGLLERALAMWRGQPYADLTGTEYPTADAASLEEMRRGARVDHAECVLESGQTARAGSELEALVTEHPFLERAWELLVIALYRQGRQADALAAYQRARTTLDDELGVEPGPALRAVERRVLTQDPRLLGKQPIGPVARTPCPYKGLSRYDVADASLFVGRERLVEELVACLVDRRLVVLVGPSGAGKSSLLRAGLLPRLAEGALNGSDHWVVRVVVPHDDPLAQVREALSDGPDLLVLDQAEGAWGDDVSRPGREGIAELMSDPGDPTRVVLSLRADFYGRLTEHPRLARLAGPATVLVGPPSREDLGRIVTEPARLVGLTVEPAAAQEIVAQTAGRAGMLPLLSTALVRLWEHREGDRLTLAGYRGSGGVHAAMERAGEDAWSALGNDDERAAARRILVRLARREDDRWVARRLPSAEAAPPSDAAAHAAADLLCDRRLVVAHTESFEIAHEALFTGWPRLVGWLSDAAASRRELERLSSAVSDWADDGHEDAQLLRGTRLLAATELVQSHPDDVAALEHEYVEASARAADRETAAERERTRTALRSRRRTRIFAGALAAALLVSVSAGFVAVRQARNANDAALTAEAGRVGALAKDQAVPVDQALLLGAQADAMHPGPVEDSDLLTALSRVPALAAAARSPSRVLSLAVSPDGHRVVTAGVQGQVVTWDARTLRRIGAQSGDPAAIVAAAADGSTVVGRQGAHPAVEVWDPNGRRILRVDVPQSPFAPQAALTSQWFAFVSAGGPTSDTVQVRRVESPSAVLGSVVVPGHVANLVTCGPARLCLATDTGELRLLAVPSGVLGPPVETTSGVPREAAPVLHLHALVASQDGTRVALGAGSNGLIEIRSLPDGHLIRTLAVTPFEGAPRAFSPNGQLLAAYADNRVQVWDVGSGELVRSFGGHVGAVISGGWSPDGRLLYTAGLDLQVLAWDMAGDDSLVRTVSLDDPADVGTAWATTASVVVGLSDGHLLFVHRPDGAVIRPSQTAGTDYLDTVRSGGRSTLVVASDLDGTVTVWDSATGRDLGPVNLPPAQLDPQVWVSDNGVTAATMRSADGPLYLIDLPTRTVRTLTLHLPAGAVPYGVFRWTHDGHVLIAAGTAQDPITQALLVDPRTGRVDHRVAVPGEPEEIAVNPTSTWLAAAGQDGNLWFVRIADGHLLAPAQNAVDGIVNNVNVSPDGRYVVTGGAPGQVRLWDTAAFRQVGPDLPAPIDAGTARVRFTPDGSLVAVFTAFQGNPASSGAPDMTAGGDLRHGPVLWVYPVGRAAWEADACHVVGRPLTTDEWHTFLPTEAYQPICQ